jgi:hypothetical protein
MSRRTPRRHYGKHGIVFRQGDSRKTRCVIPGRARRAPGCGTLRLRLDTAGPGPLRSPRGSAALAFVCLFSSRRHLFSGSREAASRALAAAGGSAHFSFPTFIPPDPLHSNPLLPLPSFTPLPSLLPFLVWFSTSLSRRGGEVENQTRPTSPARRGVGVDSRSAGESAGCRYDSGTNGHAAARGRRHAPANLRRHRVKQRLSQARAADAYRRFA